MIRTLLPAAAALATAVASSGAIAQEYAQVISIQPRMVTIQQQQCQQAVVQQPQQQQGGSTAGMLIGGVAGGILGHQIGGGTGRTVATAAGAVGGAMVGNHLGSQGTAQAQPQTVCSYVPVTVQQGEIVTFSFRGRQFQQVFDR